MEGRKLNSAPIISPYRALQLKADNKGGSVTSPAGHQPTPPPPAAPLDSLIVTRLKGVTLTVTACTTL